MKRSKFTDEQILAIVKESAGRKVADLCRVHGVTAQTWKATHGGTQLSDALSQKQITHATSQRLYRTRGRSSRGSQVVVEASWMPRERRNQTPAFNGEHCGGAGSAARLGESPL
jgi:hypothetical protein